MQNTIQTLISNSVSQYGYSPSQYSDVIEAVASDLNTALDEARSVLVREASERGISESEVLHALEQAGLYEQPAPEPEPEVEQPAEDPTSLEGRVGRIESAVERLTELAERHLGSRV